MHGTVLWVDNRRDDGATRSLPAQREAVPTVSAGIFMFRRGDTMVAGYIRVFVLAVVWSGCKIVANERRDRQYE